MVAFCAALIGVVAVGAKAEITASVPAGAHWRASPEGMPLWGPNRFWPGSGLVLRCLGPGFTVLALGPGFRPIIIVIINGHINIMPYYNMFSPLAFLVCSFKPGLRTVEGSRGFFPQHLVEGSRGSFPQHMWKVLGGSFLHTWWKVLGGSFLNTWWKVLGGSFLHTWWKVLGGSFLHTCGRF